MIVDQFEELYTLCADTQQRDEFIDRLLALSSPVAIGVRADLYGRLSSHAALARAVADNQLLLGPMGEAELKRAIIEPARVAGLRLEPGLVDLILRDVAREPGALPLLSHALRVTWERRDGRTLTVEGYRASGGVASAIAQTADSLVQSVPSDRQRLVRNLFLRLTELGDGTEDARRRVKVDELVPEDASADEVRSLLDRLAEARLVTLGEGTAEVAHEVLIREWPTLRAWLEEDRAGIRLHRLLGDAARFWDAGAREAGDLYRGTRLAAAVEWAGSHPDALNATERAFLNASVAESDRARRAQVRTNRRLRRLLGGVAVLLVAAVVAGVLALRASNQARDSARTADAQRLGALGLIDDFLDRRVLLAQAGRTLDDSIATRGYLLSVLMHDPAAIGVMHGDGDSLYVTALSLDGRVLVTGDDDGTLVLLDTSTGDRIGDPLQVDKRVNTLDFSPDGTMLAVAGTASYELNTQNVKLVNIATGKVTLTIDPGPYPPAPRIFTFVDARFSSDGRTVLVAVAPNQPEDPFPTYVRRYDAQTGKPLGRGVAIGTGNTMSTPVVATRRDQLLVTGANDTFVVDAATLQVRKRIPVGGYTSGMSPDGHSSALGGEDGSVAVLDLRTGKLRTLSGRHEDRVHGLEFTADGRTLVTRGDDGKVLVWDLRTGTVRETLAGHAGPIPGFTISADSRTLYSVGLDGRVIVWDLAGDRRLAQPFQAGGAIRDYPPPLAISPSGRFVAAGLPNGGVRLHDARTLRLLRDLPGIARGPATAIEFSKDSQTFAVTGEDGTVEFRAVATGARVRPALPSIGAPSQALAFAPDDGRLAVADLNGNLRVLDLAGGAIRRKSLPAGFALQVTFSPDGKLLAIALAHGGAQLLDSRSLRAVATLRTTSGDDINWVRFSPDGRLLATATFRTTELWDVATHRRSGTPLKGQTGYVTNAEFSPDGRMIATSGDSGTAVLWDVRSRRSLGTLPGRFGWVSARFSPDGRRLFAMRESGAAERWEISPGAWSRQACLVAGRDLTRAEWNELVPDQDYRPVCS